MRLSVVIVCFLICFSASGHYRPDAKTAAGMEVSSFISDRYLKTGFSHRFSKRFSAEGRMAVQIPKSGGLTAEEEDHYSMLTASDEPEKRAVRVLRPEIMMGFRFWSDSFHNGMYLGIFYSYGIKAKDDMVLDCGYAINIWEGLVITAGYQLRLAASLKDRTFGTEGITIGINYIF